MRRLIPTALILLTTACATGATEVVPDEVDRETTESGHRVAADGPGWVQVYSPFHVCGVISDVDRKASLRTGAEGWMADKPQAVYASFVDDELIGAPETYQRPPAKFEAKASVRALVVCFHTDETYGETVSVAGRTRPSPVGPYSYEFTTPVAGEVVNVTVDDQSPKEWTCYGSCPWVYLSASDGTTQRLGEILKDTIGPRMEHEASMTLPGTAGQTRIEVRIAEEEVGETSWLNAVAIEADGVRVKPSGVRFEAKAGDPSVAGGELGTLAERDRQYVTMRTGESIVVVFELAEVPKADVELRVTGYYTVEGP